MLNFWDRVLHAGAHTLAVPWLRTLAVRRAPIAGVGWIISA
jgi:hypothetical protein